MVTGIKRGTDLAVDLAPSLYVPSPVAVNPYYSEDLKGATVAVRLYHVSNDPLIP